MRAHARGVLAMGTALFAGIILAQAAATASRSSLYPFNAYRMYDAHWPAGSTMLEFSLRGPEGERHRPWHLLDVPFFQANRVVWRTFRPGTDAPEVQKHTLCELLIRARRPDSIAVVAERIRYTRTARGSISPVILEADTVHVCRRSPRP